MTPQIEAHRHAEERGEILRVLKEDYNQAMTSVRSLLLALDAVAVSLSSQGVGFHLQYLAGQGYVQIWRRKDMPGFRKDREQPGDKSIDIVFAKLQPKGLQLIDGVIPEDPMVKF